MPSPKLNDNEKRMVPSKGLWKFLAVENKYDDLFTVNEDGSRNGSIRIIKSSHVRSGLVSRRVGSMKDICTNIHTEDDLKSAARNINERIH